MIKTMAPGSDTEFDIMNRCLASAGYSAKAHASEFECVVVVRVYGSELTAHNGCFYRDCILNLFDDFIEALDALYVVLQDTVAVQLAVATLVGPHANSTVRVKPITAAGLEHVVSLKDTIDLGSTARGPVGEMDRTAALAPWFVIELEAIVESHAMRRYHEAAVEHGQRRLRECTSVGYTCRRHAGSCDGCASLECGFVWLR